MGVLKFTPDNGATWVPLLAGPRGEKGEKGDQGNPGLDGDTGPQGIPGKDGDLTARMADVRYERRSPLLAEAVWHVDAGQLTDAGTGLADLSGNARDAVFGAGAAAPIVLPWDGEPYLCKTRGSGTEYVTLPTLSIPVNGYIEIDLDRQQADTLYVVYAGAVETNAISFRLVGSTVRLGFATGSSLNEAIWADAALAGRHTYRVNLDANGGELFRDGVSLGYQSTGYTRSQAGQNKNVLQMASPTTEHKVYRLDIDGEHVFDPIVATADYSAIVNSGTAGGTATLVRRSTGFKTAVVDRPLLLFGGGQSAAITDPWGRQFSAEPHTMIAAVRLFDTTTFQPLLSSRGGNNVVPGVMLMRTDDNSSRYYWSAVGNVGTYSSTPAGSPSPLLVMAGGYDGSNSWVWDLRGLRYTLGGAAPSASTVDLTIGKYGSGSLAMAGEFIAAAIFDRTLTDDEVARVTDDLLGTAHVDQANPHPQYALKAEVTRTSHPNGDDVLVEAWDAGKGRWQVTHYDSGWRNITGDLLNGWEMAYTPGLLLRRVNNTVTFYSSGLSSANKTSSTLYQIPVGFRKGQRNPIRYDAVPVANATGTAAAMGLTNADTLAYTGSGGPLGYWSLDTNDPIPTSLPGTLVSPAPN